MAPVRYSAVFAVLIGIASCSAFAVEPFAATPQETAMCSAVVFGGRDRDYKIQTEGWDWLHMHHFCDCVRFRYRAMRKFGNKAEQEYDLKIGIGGCDYVLKAASPGFYMRPKIHIEKGRSLLIWGHKSEAAREFAKAIEFNPKEAEAYVLLSEVQEGGGQRGAALETVTMGLRNNPGTASLQKRYLALGGKEPFPEPVTPVPPVAESKSTNGGKEPDARSGDVAASRAPSSSEAQTRPPAASAEEEAEAKPAGDGPAATGNCRYCPPEELQRRWRESFSGEKQQQ